MVTEGRDRVKGLGYWDKGWTSFEYALAMMIKVSNISRAADWHQVLDLGQEGMRQVILTRPAPAEPLAFFGGHEYGDKTYTNGADRDAIVAPKFRETTFELLAGVRELDYSKHDWTDSEAVQLAVVLPLCAKLKALRLVGNKIGPAGVAAIGTALKSMVMLEELNLNDNDLGDEGAKTIGGALKLNTLTTLGLKFSGIGDEGVKAIGGALKSNTALTTLDLSSNADISCESGKAIGEALRENQAMTWLSLAGNWLGDEGAIAISEALRVNVTLKELRLMANNISEPGGSTIAQALPLNSVIEKIALEWNPLGSEVKDELLQVAARRDSLEVSLSL